MTKKITDAKKKEETQKIAKQQVTAAAKIASQKSKVTSAKLASEPKKATAA